ncbi:hypothetical protein MKW94_030238 [Papaver nudicaule]|uniref:Embryonic stem cell-specific 5-hydroxymethylcytosine-binding protein n=1 Tax=Papaver nudicaule TaxID=74823 RepID=A0AA41VWW1_PAPNU|nr:hypothetical protein [Papaver nudicaule]
MCGRARCSLRVDDIPRACGVNHGPIRTVQIDRYRPSYNVSPGFYVPVIHREHQGNDGGGGGQETVLHCMKWGLIPSFTKKTEKPDHYRMFNARSESISEKASFRRLLPKNRCVVAVEGFYEWKKDGSKKQPYYIHLKDGRPLVFAALYDSWKNSEGEVVYTFTIVTTSCSSAFQWLHDRMPVILGDKSSIDAWLNGSTTSGFDTLLKPFENPDLVWYPVTPAMGKASFDGPECIKEIPLKTEENNLISKFFSKKIPGNEKETNEPIKGSPKESNHPEPSGSLKAEQEENVDLPSDSEEKRSKKFDSFPLRPEGDKKCGIKRDYEELESETKPSPDKIGKLELSPRKKNSNIGKLEMSPLKKKSNIKTAGDKQSTLLSYFGKKP